MEPRTWHVLVDTEPAGVLATLSSTANKHQFIQVIQVIPLECETERRPTSQRISADLAPSQTGGPSGECKTLGENEIAIAGASREP